MIDMAGQNRRKFCKAISCIYALLFSFAGILLVAQTPAPQKPFI
jgi:hypothetical protein